MAIRTVKPTSPARRYLTYVTYDEITKTEPEKALLVAQAAHATAATARADHGAPPGRRGQAHAARRSTSAATSTGSRRGWPPSSTIRTARRAWRCCYYRDGEKRYIIAPARPQGRRHASCRGRRPTSCPATRCRSGTSRSARSCTTSSCSPAAARRCAAAPALRRQLLAKEGDRATLQAALGRGAAGPRRRAWPPIGQVGNLDHENVSVGKAGRMRWRGFRPDRARHRR